MNVLIRLLAVVGAITLLIGISRFLWPIIDSSGEILSGNYRELKIGDSKSDVVITTTTALGDSKLKVIGYRCNGEHVVSLVGGVCSEGILESNEWILSYPGIHNESITLFFEGEYLVKMEYFRDFTTP